jgi:DNA-binding transcriptional LysR family regulator
MAGQGIALGRLELIAPLLADGRLVTIPTTAPGVRNAHAYWLVQSEPNPRKDVRNVAEWIRAEAAEQHLHAPGASELA